MTSWAVLVFLIPQAVTAAAAWISVGGGTTPDQRHHEHTQQRLERQNNG